MKRGGLLNEEKQLFKRPSFISEKKSQIYIKKNGKSMSIFFCSLSLDNQHSLLVKVNELIKSVDDFSNLEDPNLQQLNFIIANIKFNCCREISEEEYSLLGKGLYEDMLSLPPQPQYAVDNVLYDAIFNCKKGITPFLNLYKDCINDKNFSIKDAQICALYSWKIGSDCIRTYRSIIENKRIFKYFSNLFTPINFSTEPQIVYQSKLFKDCVNKIIKDDKSHNTWTSEIVKIFKNEQLFGKKFWVQL